ncbi:Fe-S cluster assembly protein SufD [Mesorhizobium sp. Z1-4]|uniref:Fe-S cluster assembly protein SufD n=1 Tax=Mesorhizobium sp. Z1-4 TaxID=2448478 RepID=UPI000FDC6930|nr:Fe-S cluster assembly protein SufD [Mesorhizobium sp. Z1-4]
MNVHTEPQLTPAETALAEAFAKRLSDLPGNEDVTLQRDAAMELVKRGLPTRKVESWHYTDLRRLLNAVPEFDRSAAPQAVPVLIDGSSRLVTANGRAEAAEAPKGVVIERLSKLLPGGDLASPLATYGGDDAVGAINAAFVSDGYSIAIEDDAKIEWPIELQNLHAGGQTHTRFAVTVGKGAKVTFVERQTGNGRALVSCVDSLKIADGAEVHYVILVEQPDTVSYLGQFQAEIGEKANLSLFIMNVGGKLVRQEVRVTMPGEGGHFELRGVNLLAGSTHNDVTMVLDHSALDTTSTELIRNIVTDKAHGVFQGQIRVAREAQKTDAKMACNTLVLSDEGEFSVKPELEIFADDVACGHGATVAEIDHAHLFYLMARGIPEKEARGLLVKAFLAEVIEELDDETLVAVLEQRLEDWFEQHG